MIDKNTFFNSIGFLLIFLFLFSSIRIDAVQVDSISIHNNPTSIYILEDTQIFGLDEILNTNVTLIKVVQSQKNTVDSKNKIERLKNIAKKSGRSAKEKIATKTQKKIDKETVKVAYSSSIDSESFNISNCKFLTVTTFTNSFRHHFSGAFITDEQFAIIDEFTFVQELHYSNISFLEVRVLKNSFSRGPPAYINL